MSEDPLAGYSLRDRWAMHHRAQALWEAAVRRGDDWGCKYWSLASCGYRDGCNCGCSDFLSYLALAIAEVGKEQRFADYAQALEGGPA